MKTLNLVDGNFGRDKEQKIGLVECFFNLALARQDDGGHWEHLRSIKTQHVNFVPRSELSAEELKEIEWDDELELGR